VDTNDNPYVVACSSVREMRGERVSAAVYFCVVCVRHRRAYRYAENATLLSCLLYDRLKDLCETTVLQ